MNTIILKNLKKLQKAMEKIICPHYQGCGRCGLRREGKLFQTTIDDYCESNFTSCSIFTEHFLSEAPKAVEEINERLAKIENSQKITPKFLRQEVRTNSIENAFYDLMI